MGKKTRNPLIISFLLTVLMTLAGSSVQAPAAGVSGAAYQVQKNDSLYKIAGSQLGVGDRWDEIFELNKDAIRDPSLIYTGQILKLPGSGQELLTAEQNVPDEQK